MKNCCMDSDSWCKEDWGLSHRLGKRVFHLWQDVELQIAGKYMVDVFVPVVLVTFTQFLEFGF